MLARRVGEPGVAEWAALAEAWDDLCAHMDLEAPDWRRGPLKAPALTAMMGCFRELEVA